MALLAAPYFPFYLVLIAFKALFLSKTHVLKYQGPLFITNETAGSSVHHDAPLDPCEQESNIFIFHL